MYSLFILLLVGIEVPGSSIGCYIDFEAEYGTFTGTTMHRSEASNRMTVLLTFAETIEHHFTTTSGCEVTLGGLYYSNDGDTDNVTLSIDGLIIGLIETIEEYGNGHLWNVIRNSGSIGKEISINSGKHSLLLLVTSPDLNGVEIDKTSLMFSCENDDDASAECPQSVVQVNDAAPDEKDSSTSLTQTEINALLGTTLSGVSVFIALVSAIAAIYKYRKRHQMVTFTAKQGSINENEETEGYVQF